MSTTATRYRTIGGHTVEAVQYATREGEPVYCCEVVDGSGEVVEFIDRVHGEAALSLLVARRRWVAL